MAKHITGYAGLPFMDKVGRDKIQALEDNQIQVDRDDTSITGINDTVHDSLETDDKRIIGGINEVNKKVKTLDTEVKDIVENMKPIKTFNTFPSDTVLDLLPLNSTFEVNGFYEIGDMPKTLYKKVGYWANSIKKSNYYITPINGVSAEIFLPSFGIRTGKAYAESNSTILSSINISFGSLLKLPVGDFYFSKGIDLKPLQLSLSGECMAFTSDKNTNGITRLIFKNLAHNEYGINIGTGTLQNVIIEGSNTVYSYSIDRTKTYTDPTNIESETYNSELMCYGIKGGVTSILTNVYVKDFYYGCYLDTGNIYITNFFAKRCHIGLSIGNDTKCKGVYGWGVHTLLEIRGSISSASQVRCDSCHHLVRLNGVMGSVQLDDLDADYCLGSIVIIGGDQWTKITNLIINGMRGRCCTLNVYDSSKDTLPTVDNIASVDDIDKWSTIAVVGNSNLMGAVIILNDVGGENPLDGTSTYKTPGIILCAGKGCVAGINIIFSKSYKNSDNTEATNITKNYILKRFKSFSVIANNFNFCLTTSSGIYYYDRNNPNDSDIKIKKVTTEDLV